MYIYIYTHGTATVGKVVGQISITLSEKIPHSQATEVAASRLTDATYLNFLRNFLSTEQALESIRVFE